MKIRHELIDQDYINKLSNDEKDWLNRFNEEYVSANFNHDGERVHPKVTKSKTVKRTGKRKRYDVYKKDCADRNNARNRDTLGLAKRDSTLAEEKHIRPHLDKSINLAEDNINRCLDLKARYVRRSVK